VWSLDERIRVSGNEDIPPVNVMGIQAELHRFRGQKKQFKVDREIKRQQPSSPKNMDQTQIFLYRENKA